MKHTKRNLLILLMLAAIVTISGCGSNGRPDSLGDLFTPSIYLAAGDTSSAAFSFAARKATDRRTWVQAGQGAREVGHTAADRTYGLMLFISCLLPDWQGENHPEGYGETYGASSGR